MPILTDFLTDIAEAIRNKKGTTDKINAQNFASEIESIETGSGSEPILQEKTITENGTYTPDTAYDGFSKVNVNVPIPSGYVKPSGNLDIVVNGSYDVTNKSSVNVNVPTSSSGGECDQNHIIEVDTLPTENISEKDIYKMGDSYYKQAKEFMDVIVFMEGTAHSLIMEYTAYGVTNFNFYVVHNYESVENPDIFLDESSLAVNMYYDASRNDVYVYDEGSWLSYAEYDVGLNGGAITDISQATTDGYYYALLSNGWKVYISDKYNGEVVIS